MLGLLKRTLFNFFNVGTCAPLAIYQKLWTAKQSTCTILLWTHLNDHLHRLSKQSLVRFLSRVNLILPLGILMIKNKIVVWQMGSPQAVFIFLIFQSTLNTLTQTLMMNNSFLFRMNLTRAGFKPQTSWVASRRANHWAMIHTYGLFICNY